MMDVHPTGISSMVYVEKLEYSQANACVGLAVCGTLATCSGDEQRIPMNLFSLKDTLPEHR
jgi:hypothetical protein